MNAGNSGALAWHYTTGQKFPSIVAAGYLFPSTGLLTPGERPVLWFSLRQDFEPTARKANLVDGQLRVMSVEETFSTCGGLVRFGVKPRDLMTGEKLRTRARIPLHVWKSLVAAGRRQKADPNLWFGFLGSFPIEETVIDVMDEKGLWQRVQPADGHAPGMEGGAA